MKKKKKKNLASILPCSYSLVLRNPPCLSSASCLSGSFSPRRTPSCRCTPPPFGQLPSRFTIRLFFPLSLLSSPAIDTREIYDTTAERKIYKYAGFSYANILTNTSFERFFPLFLFFFFVILLLLLDHTDYRWYYIEGYYWKFLLLSYDTYRYDWHTTSVCVCVCACNFEYLLLLLLLSYVCTTRIYLDDSSSSPSLFSPYIC